MSKMLPEKISDWIGERPDEWIMKEWLRDAKALQAENQKLREALEKIAGDETDYPRQVARAALKEGI